MRLNKMRALRKMTNIIFLPYPISEISKLEFREKNPQSAKAILQSSNYFMSVLFSYLGVIPAHACKFANPRTSKHAHTRLQICKPTHIKHAHTRSHNSAKSLSISLSVCVWALGYF